MTTVLHHRPVVCAMAVLFVLLALAGCVRVPEGIEPVTGFDAERYLGTWYEIARLDHRFERGLSRVSATYGTRDDGGLTVLNKGWNAEEGEWKSASGKAYFVEDADTAFLKVSFFGPFYGGYVVFDLDDDYQHALVSGPNRDYLWLLARTPELEPGLQARLVGRAAAAGFETDALIFVTHD